MKKLILCCLFSVFFVVLLNKVSYGAQEKKLISYSEHERVAVVNLDTIQKKAYVWRDLQKKLNARRVYYQKQFLVLQNQIKRKVELLKRDHLSPSSQAFKQRSRDISLLVSRLKSLSDLRHSDMETMYIQAVRKINDTIQNILKELAKEKHVDLILNSSESSSFVLYTNTSYDLTKDVLERLNHQLRMINISPKKG